MISLLSAIEPLRIANRLVGKEVFRWECLSEDGNAVYASNGMALQQAIYKATDKKPLNLFVNASFHPEQHINKETIKWLQGLNQQKSVIGALDTGCYLLAQAKLLDGYKVTLHWEAKPALEERYPNLNISNELFEIDRTRITCAGGTAVSDMVLHLIEQYTNADMAIRVCDQLIKNGVRNREDYQTVNWMKRVHTYNPKVLKALELMSQHLEVPLSSKELATALSISTRQLERLFIRYLNISPSSYYLKLRIEHAHNLLLDSSLNITQIAFASGFGSAAHFGRCFRDFYGITATQLRTQAN
ncbi:GlxA family transcriptional regulator [Marinomonas sp. 2405UD66-6]|uniref:GlxA family transcriptional regulator n=1 Tax=Marinomonas sp. 2405UD66-6 TaxID=3391834 RepID=UPI0039C9CFAE